MKSSISQYSQRGFFQNICKICRYDDKICERKLSYFGINILSHPIFFGQRARWNFGKFVVVLSTISTVSCSAERSLSILQRPKTEEKHLGIRLPQSSGTAMYWACLCQRSRYWKSVWWIFIRKSSFYVPFRIDFYTKQREWVILSLVKKVK